MSDEERVEHPWISKSIERAQKTVEGHNFSIRKHLLEFDDVLNNQRKVIYKKRQDVLEGKNLKNTILEMMIEVVKDIIYDIAPEKTYPEEWDYEGLARRIQNSFLVDYTVDTEKADLTKVTREVLENDICEKLKEEYDKKEKEAGAEMMREIERNIMLQTVDNKWRDHLYNMDKLKEGIGLRAYAHKDPLLEYKRDGFELFQSMVVSMEHDVVEFLYKVQVVDESQLERKHRTTGLKETRPTFVIPKGQQPSDHHREQREMHTNAPEGQQKVETYRREKPKVGRNEPCPCGSGKKYKNCCGKNT